MVGVELGKDHPLLQKIREIRSLTKKGSITKHLTTIRLSNGNAVIKIPKKIYVVDLEKGKVLLFSKKVIEKCFKSQHEIYLEALLLLLKEDFSSLKDGS